MSQSVLQLSTSDMNQMKSYYASYMKEKTPQGAIFAAKLPRCSITAYRSGKVLFQGANHSQEANKWGKVNKTAVKQTTAKQATPTRYTPSPHLFTSSHAGSDEAGTGDYFGPITVACAYIQESQIDTLKRIGVRDSKHLKDPEIQQIARKIVEMGIPYSLVVLRNEKYNVLQKRGWSQGKMKTMLHHYAYKKLCTKLEAVPEGWIIDQFAQPDVYKRHLASEKASLPANTYFLTKAESYSIAVATGSIIARSAFVKQMNNLSKEAGMELPKGASKYVDQAAATLIQTHGDDALKRYAKVHFANTDKAYKLIP
ncbi:ribonuclease HIII [Pontibacillus litoralis]|uniref:Ribonuclease HIII n=1 Tax=Pontibacillus litoralis JSM 072002 TaxID=1385512 RepID=A0A0A5GAN1_9BACI|nr:ribonuclease HIII [Pontibacillus litoralis]KGX89059.1 ribonuclease HIII [Pontibacillus litoralis JSM 072002]